MNYEDIINTIDDVKEKLEYEYNKWNISDESYIIEECIWIINALEIRLNNLYIQAKKHVISCKTESYFDL